MKAVVLLYHRFGFTEDVAGPHGEVPLVGADPFMLGPRYEHLLEAIRVPAFAEEPEFLARRGPSAVGPLLHAVIGDSEGGFVIGDALLAP